MSFKFFRFLNKKNWLRAPRWDYTHSGGSTFRDSIIRNVNKMAVLLETVQIYRPNPTPLNWYFPKSNLRQNWTDSASDNFLRNEQNS